ncbi:uncharacterized protein LOC134247134 isoform X2 [Saccostrea cucullata]
MKRKIHVYNRMRKQIYVSRKSYHKRQRGKQTRCSVNEEIRKIARILPKSRLKMKEDPVIVLTHWIKYIKDLKKEQTRLLTLKKTYLQIDMMHRKLNQRMQVLESKLDDKLKNTQ